MRGLLIVFLLSCFSLLKACPTAYCRYLCENTTDGKCPEHVVYKE